MSEYDYEYVVFIGRFQPPHISHIQTAIQALSVGEKLIVLLGSADAAPSMKNPWSWEERRTMFSRALGPEYSDRVIYKPIRDYFYNEYAWIVEVQSAIRSVAGDTHSIAMIGHYKDNSSYYLKFFPEMDFIPSDCNHLRSSTQIRDRIFTLENMSYTPEPWKDRRVEWRNDVHKQVKEFIIEWWESDTAKAIREEAKFVYDYRDKWKDAPHPPMFVTADALIVKGSHILVVTRGSMPGKGLYALPGGFVKQDEPIIKAAVREAKEETKIDVPRAALEQHISAQKVFDHPDRDSRGRTITHAFVIDLGPGKLPNVKGASDAWGAEWIPIREVLENPRSFYADHAQIIYHFLLEKSWA